MQSPIHTWQEEHIFLPLRKDINCTFARWTWLLWKTLDHSFKAHCRKDDCSRNTIQQSTDELLTQDSSSSSPPLPPLLLLLHSILINSFKIAYVHTLYFEDIYYPLLLTFPKSTPVCPQISFYPLLQLTKSNLCYAHSHGCGAIHLPGTIPLKKTNSLSTSIHKLSVVIQMWLGFLSPCCVLYCWPAWSHAFDYSC